MNRMRQALSDYLRLRRALGFKLREHGLLLPDFLDSLQRAGATTITTELAVAWATAPVGVDPHRWQARLSLVRGFARYLQGLDPATQVPPVGLLASRAYRPIPDLYSDEQISRLLVEADALRPRLRAVTYRTLFGLLAATGMRVGEAIGLQREDLDVNQGLLTVRQAKFGKSRQLPLQASTVDALVTYATGRDLLCPSPRATTFFVSTAGTPLLYVSVRKVFIDLAQRAGLESRAGARYPHLHGFRHTFTVQTLLTWHHQGADVASRLPLLSAYLGHSHPASTYWYLQATPELLAVAAQRLEQATGARS